MCVSVCVFVCLGLPLFDISLRPNSREVQRIVVRDIPRLAKRQVLLLERVLVPIVFK